MSPKEITKIIRNRRSIYPPSYQDKVIPKEIILEILENANWAPNHRKTEPWRFKVFQGESSIQLSEYLGEYYKQNTPNEKFSEMKLKRSLRKPIQASCTIAICMKRDEEERLPEWEEISAVAMAVQNMWLTCTAYGIGAYWSSPKSALEANDFLNLTEGEKCLGFLYMGYADLSLPKSERKPIGDKVVWR